MSSTPDTPHPPGPAPEGSEHHHDLTDAAPDGLTGARAEQRFLDAVEHRLTQQAVRDAATSPISPHLEEDADSPVRMDNPE